MGSSPVPPTGTGYPVAWPPESHIWRSLFFLVLETKADQRTNNLACMSCERAFRDLEDLLGMNRPMNKRKSRVFPNEISTQLLSSYGIRLKV